MDNDNTILHITDATFIGISVGALMQFLPPISAILSIIWLLLRIGESAYLQKFFRAYNVKWLIVEKGEKDDYHD